MSGKIPVHIAIIPDGNRRWAKAKGLIATEGHKRAGSYEHIKDLFQTAKELGIKYLSFWGFSTENWQRDRKEIDELFNLISKAVDEWRKEAIKNRIRFRHIGRRDRIPREVMDDIEKLEKETEGFSDFNVQLCLDYGGRDEIIRAMNKIINYGYKEVDERRFSEFLDTNTIPEPDMIIRTSGEQRTSGFMPFQSIYSELYFSEVHFPDFDSCELKKAVEDFGKRKRNFGK